MSKILQKNPWLKDIKILVWDLDGTLYPINEAMSKRITDLCIKAVAKAQNLSLKQATKMFHEKHKKLKSSTRTLLQLGVDKDYVIQGDWYNQAQIEYVKKDTRLITLFDKYSHIQHILHTNSRRKPALKKLKKMGLKTSIFDKIYTASETAPYIKPDLEAFQMVLDFTKKPAHKHLYFGDSVGKDLIPASKIGMKTCVLWKEDSACDLSFKDVYETEEVMRVI